MGRASLSKSIIPVSILLGLIKGALGSNLRVLRPFDPRRGPEISKSQ